VTLPRTPSQTVGPYYAIGLCRRTENELVPAGESGAVRLIGQLLDGEEMPVSDGVIEIWDAACRRWGRCGTDADGRFSFVVPLQTPHFEAYVFARGLLRHQLTRIYLSEEPADAQLSSLVAEQEDGALRFDIRLQGGRQTVFFAV
jgi:protocatechuate 3,4-dioxygenase alpha subunit